MSRKVSPISPPQNLEELERGPVAGPTVMRRAHLNGLRKAVARGKAWFRVDQPAEPALKALLLTYLGEWEHVYGEGVEVLGMTNTERTIMVIRRDTVQQMLRELA